jgi:ubiquinone biosynthesis protein UbiJ
MLGPSLLFSGLNNFIRRYYGHPAYQALWQKLDGHAIEIQINGVGNWVLTVVNGQLTVNTLGSDENGLPKPSITLTGPLRAFLRLAGTRDFVQAKKLGLCLSGDLTLALSFAQMLKNPPIDFTERLSGWIGDVAAHRLSQFGMGLYRHLKEGPQNMAAMSTEYLQEEALLLPTPSEIEEWMSAVDTLRDDVARLAARIELIPVTKKHAHAE